MKIKLYLFLVSIVGLTLLNNCNEVLQTEEQSAIDGDRVFSDPDIAELYLNNLYALIMPGFSATSNTGMTEESIGRDNFINGVVMDPTSAADTETPGDYSYETFTKIRNVNLFLVGLSDGSIDQDIKDSYRGQALFLRAYIYFKLFIQYGGVPIITIPIDNNDDIDDALPRDPASAVIDQIVKDLDEAILLIGTYSSSDYGRITKSAAAALKGRALLFYASPQFDPEGVTSVNGISERWERAYQANKEAKEIALSEGHGLYEDFAKIFINEDNKEAILTRKYTTGISVHGYENSVRPSSVDNSGNPLSTPSWTFVKSFPMKSGLSIEDPSSGYNEQAYWYNRDPRLAATVGYNSVDWKFAGRDDLRQWTYVNNTQEVGIIPSNGFYLKKNINTTITNTQTVATPTDWIEIRFAEVLLNLAECANEVGKQDEALFELYAIRSRAGIEEGAGNYGIKSGLNKVELREFIMNERLIELAFENKRYWDLRRRNMYLNGLGGTKTGLTGTIRERIVTTVNTQYILDNYEGLTSATEAFKFFESDLLNSLDWTNPEIYAQYFITTVEDGEAAPIAYIQPKYNFFYLPFKAVTINTKLEQTIGWADGTFDPLAD